MLYELTANQKSQHFEVLFSFILCNNNKQFLDQIGLGHTMKSGFYTTSKDQLSGCTEKRLQSMSQRQTCTKKWTRSLAVCCPSDSLQPSEPGKTNASEKHAQQIDEMHQQMQSLQPALVKSKGPVLLQDNKQQCITQPMLQKLNKLGYES